MSFQLKSSKELSKGKKSVMNGCSSNGYNKFTHRAFTMPPFQTCFKRKTLISFTHLESRHPERLRCPRLRQRSWPNPIPYLNEIIIRMSALKVIERSREENENFPGDASCVEIV